MTTTCFCSCEIHPTTRGGAGVFVHHAARRLLVQGHSVFLLLDLPRHDFARFDKHVRPSWDGSERCAAFLVEDLGAALPIRPHEAPTPAYFNSLRWAAALQSLALTHPIDLVEFYDFSGPAHAALALRAFGLLSAPQTIAVRVHTPLDLIDSVGGTRYLDRDRWSMHALERAAFRLADAVLVPSDSFYTESLRDRYQIEPRRAVVSVPAMGEGLRDADANARASPPAPNGPVTIAFIGRMFQIKGVDQFVHAAVELLRRHPTLNLTFDVIGSDSSESPLGESYIAYLRSLIPETLRPKFLFPGHVPHEHLGERLRNVLFAVFPSRLESFGYAMHEARAFALPLIVNDIPAARDFLVHERDALFYDGSTDSLIAAMERLLADPPLRLRLAHPPLSLPEPLGPFYHAPRILRAPSAEPHATDATVLILGRSDATLAALRVQSHPPSQVIVLDETTPNAEETVWLLARPWHARDAHARPLAFAEVRTTDSLVLLQAGDQPDPDWLALCLHALNANPALAFAGTWGHRNARVVPSLLDIAPESWPFERGHALTRALTRTTPGRLLLDALDPAFGHLADIARVYRAIESGGFGLLLPQPKIQLADDPRDPPDPNLLKFLIARFSTTLGDRLAAYAAHLFDHLLAARAGAPPDSHDPSLEHKLAVADQLGGKTLMRLGWRKAVRRLRGQAPPS
jgi:glycosyltransferase involved in cell wall biosynthesis